LKIRLSRVVFKNTSVQLVGRGVILFFGLVTTSLLTRSLGPDLYGDYIFLTAFWLFLVSFSDWGTPFIGIRELSQQKTLEKKRLVFTNLVCLRFYLLLASLLLGLLAIISLPLFSGLRRPAFICLGAVVLTSLQTNMMIVFQALLLFGWQTFIEALNSGLFLLLVVVNFAKGGSLTGAILALIGARFLPVMFAWFKGKRLSVWPGKTDKKLQRFLWKEALPTGGLLFLSTAYDRLVDTSFLRHFWPSSTVGIYGLSYKFYGNLILPAYFLSRSLLPILSQKRNSTRRSSAFRLGVSWSLLGAFLVVGASWFFSPWIIKLLGGEAFSGSILLLRVLIFSLPFTYLNHIFGFTLIASGKQILSFKIGLLSLVWNLLLNWWAIPRFSALGAAGVTVGTEVLVCLLSACFVYKSSFMADTPS